MTVIGREAVNDFATLDSSSWPIVTLVTSFVPGSPFRIPWTTRSAHPASHGLRKISCGDRNDHGDYRLVHNSCDPSA